MHVLILEVNLSGHHPAYLEKIAEAHLELGRTVTVVVSEEFQAHPAINRLRQSCKHSLRIVLLSEDECTKAMKSRWGNVVREIALWRTFRKAFRLVTADQSVDFVFLPYADYCLNAIGLFGSPFQKIAWSGICMRPAFHYKACDVIAPSPIMLQLKRLLFNRLMKLPTLSHLFSIDELLVSYVTDRNQALAHRLRYLPDPAELPLRLDSSNLRQHYDIPANVRVVLVYGAIDERKGLFLLLDALASEQTLSEWHVLVVGQQAEPVRAALSSARWDNLRKTCRIHVIDAFVTDKVEQHVFAMCDVVWLAYVGHYQMSGVLVRAGLHRKPIIACEEGLIGWYARNKHVGVTVDQNWTSTAAALRVMSDIEKASSFAANGHEQFHSHTWSKYMEMLTSKAHAK